MLQDDPVFKDASKTVLEQVDQAYSLVEGHVARYKPWGAMYTENLEYDAQAVIDKARHHRNARELEDFQASISKFHKEHEDVTNLPPNVGIGVMRVTLSHMKQTVEPTPLKCLDEIHALLPVLARERNTKLTEEVNSTTSVLTTKIRDFAHFVEVQIMVEGTC